MKTISSLIPVIFLILLCSCHSSRHKSKPVEEKHIEVKDITKFSDKNTGLLLKEAESWLGVPYRYGGNDREGVDCSGMVVQVFLSAWDKKLPRTCIQQAEFCQELNEKEILPGDLVFFATGKDPERISHVGILLDNDRFIHSSSTKGVVVSNLSTPYYQRTLRKFGRVRR